MADGAEGDQVVTQPCAECWPLPYLAQRARMVSFAPAPTSNLWAGSLWAQPLVHVVAALSGEELLQCWCRCRHDLSMVLAVQLRVLPGEQRLLLPGGEWTDPALPAELEQLGWDGEAIVQLLVVPETRSIPAPPELLQAIQECLHPEHMTSAWFHNLGEPAFMAFLRCPWYLSPLGYVVIARALLLYRRIEELLPTVGYDPAMVLRTMKQDKTFSEDQHISDADAKEFIKFLDAEKLLNMQRLISLGYLEPVS